MSSEPATAAAVRTTGLSAGAPRPPARPAPRLYRRLQNALDRRWLRRWFGWSVHVYIAGDQASLRRPARPPREVRLGRASAAMLPALAEVRPERVEALRQRLAAGHWCFAAWSGERCLAYLWAVPGPGEVTSLFGCRWRIPADAVWIYDLYSRPGVVGACGHLNDLLWHAMGERWRQVIGQVELDNRASRAAHASLGYGEMGTIASWRLGPWRWHRLASRARPGRRWRWGRAAIGPEDWLAGKDGTCAA